MQRKTSRRVDWSVTTDDDSARARLVSPSTQASGLAQLTSAILTNPSPRTIDRVLRESVEFARNAIHLERAAIFLVSPDSQSMVGTWGTDAHRRTTDEHDLAFEIDDLVRQFFARSAQGYAWSVYEDCPMIAHENGQSRVLGHGWLACTTIQGTHEPIGILFNDTAITREPLDEAKQARAAVLCSLLGRILETCRDRLFASQGKEGPVRHPLVRNATQLLASDPSLTCQEVAQHLHLSKGYLTRVFKRNAHASIVEYRNELRLAKFLSRVNSKSLLDAALGAGFGSYAQFHRVFRARFGKAPRDYLFEQQTAPKAKRRRTTRL
jgi:AraC-like DNA-binding protein